MKKILTLIASIFMLASCGSSPTKPTCEHNYVYESTNETHWQYCDKCQETTQREFHMTSSNYKGDKDGHYKYCTVCEYKMKNYAHTPGDWVTDRVPTAEQDGQRHKECTVCGYVTITETVPFAGHIHNYVSKSDATNHWQECSGCGDKKEVAAHTFPSTYQSDENNHWRLCSTCSYKDGPIAHVEGSWIIDKEETSTEDGQRHKECTICHTTTQIEKIHTKSDKRIVNFYAINDFHGECDKMAKTVGYLKERNNEGNTILLNSGDMFQGSMLSNSNYGQLLTKCMNEAGFDEFTFGNHDFDWGIDNLKAIIDTASEDMPFLGANIYNYDFDNKTFGDFASDLAQKYVIREMENGLRVGIIGVIGEDQITSICTQFVKSIGFKAPTPIIKELAATLRNNLACDLVVVSSHCDADGLVGSSNVTYRTSGSSKYVNGVTGTNGLEDYVDAVFMAHTHQSSEIYECNGLPFIQAGSYGKQVGNISLSVQNGTTTVETKRCVSYSTSWPSDKNCETLISNASKEIESEANEVLIKNLSSSLSISTTPKLVTEAMAKACEDANLDIDIAITNDTRQTIYAGEVTYSKLYDAIPFDNVIYVATVSGSDLLRVCGWSYTHIYRVNPDAFVSNKTYKVAVIDYMLYHCNSSRIYNYFSSFTRYGEPVELKKAGYNLYNYRFVTRDYLRSLSNFDITRYTTATNRNDNSKISQAVTF